MLEIPTLNPSFAKPNHENILMIGDQPLPPNLQSKYQQVLKRNPQWKKQIHHETQLRIRFLSSMDHLHSDLITRDLSIILQESKKLDKPLWYLIVFTKRMSWKLFNQQTPLLLESMGKFDLLPGDGKVRPDNLDHRYLFSFIRKKLSATLLHPSPFANYSSPYPSLLISRIRDDYPVNPSSSFIKKVLCYPIT